ncbi:MAG: AtpZ/AtpI family protein [Bacteroidia bacterium]
MAVIIGFCAWLGSFLDSKYEMHTNWFTISLSLFGVFSATYLTLKDFLKPK